MRVGTVKCLVNGVPLHYEDIGEGRPLLMLHGWPSDRRLMTYHMEPIFESRDGWRRLHPDLPGMGETPGSEDIVCNDDVLEIVLGLLVAVVPGERFAIAGTSYGGYLARAVIHRRLSQIDGALLWAPAVRFDDVRQLPLHQVLVRDQTAVDSVEPHETP